MNTITHRTIGKKPIHANSFALTEKNAFNCKASKFKVGDRVRITKYKNIFNDGYINNWSKELFAIDPVLKVNP